MPAAQIDNPNSADNLTYLHIDHLGSPRIATNDMGNVTWRWDSDGLGSTPANEIAGVTINLRFPGQYYDSESGLHYNYFRHYDP